MPKIATIDPILSEMEEDCDDFEQRIQMLRDSQDTSETTRKQLDQFERILGNQRGMIENIKHILERPYF